MRMLVFANGELNDGPAVQAALDEAGEAGVIAADGGARLALACQRVPQLVIGDLDSLTPDELAGLTARGATVKRYPAAKDETDLELALLAAVEQGASWIRIIGALGGRADHLLANIMLLNLPALAGRDVRLVTGEQMLWLIGPGQHTVHGVPGDMVSLIPLAGDAYRVRTEQLEYPLKGETLRFGPARGVSNVMSGSTAQVSLDAGLLVVVHTAGRRDE